MPWVIGTDEAGYGPNLGPLVVAASCWEASQFDPGADWYPRLASCVRQGRARDAALQTPIADSKRLYQAGGSLAELELGVLAAAHVAEGSIPTDWRDAWQRWKADGDTALDALPWYSEFNCPLPVAADVGRVQACADVLHAGLTDAGLSLTGIRARALFPPVFNRRLARCGNKASVLSEVTLQLVQEILSRTEADRVYLFCDKHGGRNRYGPLLQSCFSETLVEVRQEGRQQSVYRWGTTARRVEARFAAGGDRLLPSALASMLAKYLRELAMQAFNSFWERQIPGLRPTAGYPADAKRFRREIAARMQQLGIPDELIWRSR